MDLDTKKHYIRNINKLSPLGNSINCGDFGIIRCDCPAYNSWSTHRLFSVSKSKKIANGGNWTFSGLRKAILAAD